MRKGLKYFFLILLLLLEPIYLSANSCFLSLYHMTGMNFVLGTEALPQPKSSNLTSTAAIQILKAEGGLYDSNISRANLYRYLGELRWEEVDSAYYIHFLEKKKLIARTLLNAYAKLHPALFGVHEATLSNGDTVWLGKYGHYIRLRATDGLFFKGHLNINAENITETLLLNDTSARPLEGQ